jgi:hypothetical protein
MTVIIPHHKTKEEAIRLVDGHVENLFEIPGTGAVQLTDQRRNWNGSTLEFSMTARFGFIALPMSGTVAIDDTNVTVNVELPTLVTTFIGEDKLRAGVEGKVRGMLSA